MFIKLQINKLSLLYRIFITLLIFLFVASIFFEIVIHTIPQAAYLFPFVKKGFSLICHQNDEKIISLFGFHSLVCARCTGIYLGMFLISIYTMIRPIIKTAGYKLFIIFTAPMIADVIFVNMKLYHYSKISAIITGLLFGSILFVYLYNGLNLLIIENRIRH